MPRVSVIVPTFNRRDSLICTIRSALGQTFQDIEILVIDDGSGDDSAVEVLRHLGPDPERAESLWRQHIATASGTCGFGFWIADVPLQYVYQANRGMGAARNRGLASARGDMISFLEPGFQWDPHFLERGIQFLDENAEAWMLHGRPVAGRAPQRNGKKRRGATEMTFEEVVAGGNLCASAVLARRRCIDFHGGFDENLPACEDYDLWVRIAAHVPIHHLADCLVLIEQAPPVPGWSLDRYRVYALEKAFQSGHLSSEQRRRVAEELVDRCDSLVEGYRKRNNIERANFYDRKRKKFEIEVTKLESSSRSGGTSRARAAEATVGSAAGGFSEGDPS
ncbi:MAG: glycosyltransferase family 2 protein [Candidatus Eisenbacteria bacterium]|nr:glycosyltransferase [Candidatus Eisenbacteria bacterium]